MQVGFIGLGKMGRLMASNLSRDFDVIGYDIDKAAREEAKKNGIKIANDFVEFLKMLYAPRTIFIMVPHGKPVDDVIASLTASLSKGDVLIDAGNSNYKDSILHYEQLKKNGIQFLDAGTSGGLEGAKEGASFTIGGDREVYEKTKAVFEALAAKDGVCYTGKSGSGHFVKMVHNAVEYALMQAYAEGFEFLSKSCYEINLADVASVWNNGALIRSRLLELCEDVLREDNFDGVKGAVRGETEDLVMKIVEEAKGRDATFSVIAMALDERIKSRMKESFTSKLVAALRNKFGGHTVERK